MKPTYAFFIIVVSTVLFATACQGGGSFTGPHCAEGTCVRLEAAPQAGSVGTIVPVTIIVESQVDVSELYITLDAAPGEADIVGERQWIVHAQPNQPITRTGQIRPKVEGYVQVVGRIVWGKGPRYTSNSITLQVTAFGITPRPTVYPLNVITVPSGATRVLPVPPPREQTPDPSKPSPTRPATLSPGTPSPIPTPPIRPYP